ncbi:hypothetical protein DVH24_030940 [Malus domestica]|uniref:Uncharacterized protein n=1 Tax=Malus domestica TaxID=3750 RepID=A0A498HH07_MALDO|nr:hypothetical protein DVH24_030940 [Malus domestica]
MLSMYLSDPIIQQLIKKSQPDVFDSKIDGPLKIVHLANLVPEKMRIFIVPQCSNKVYIVLYLGERNKYEVPLKYLLDPTLQQVIKKSQPAGIWMFDAKIDELIEAACTANTFDQLLKICQQLILRIFFFFC